MVYNFIEKGKSENCLGIITLLSSKIRELQFITNLQRKGQFGREFTKIYDPCKIMLQNIPPANRILYF